MIRAYGEIGEKGLWENIEYFLKRVIPVAEECGVVMELHPDDPPYPIFGLPRVITCEENLDRYLSIVDSPANSLCLCTGSLGSSPKNDIPAMVRKYSAMKRIGLDVYKRQGCVVVHMAGLQQIMVVSESAGLIQCRTCLHGVD